MCDIGRIELSSQSPLALQAVERLKARVHPHRAAGGYRHHFHFGSVAVAGPFPGQEPGLDDRLPQQPQTAEICWQSYAQDNNDLVVPNNSVESGGTNGDAGAIAAGASWCLAAPTTANVQSGMLFPYNSSLGIYHCPADRSTLSDPSGSTAGPLRARSYNLSESVNGYPEYIGSSSATSRSFKKLTQIGGPNVANCLVFIDENEYTPPGLAIWHAHRLLRRHPDLVGYARQPPQPGGQSLLCGWPCRALEVGGAEGLYRVANWPQAVPPAEMPDWLRVKACIKQTMD